MIERRRAERVDLVDPGVGSLRLVQDVEILQLGPDEAVVVAPGAIPRGERLLLEIRMERDVAPATALVRAIENRVAIDDGSLRRHVRLERIQRGAEAAPGDDELSRARRAQGRTVMGALIRRVPVRIVQASTGGCVFECPSVVVEGSVGFVQVGTSRHGHSEAVRISRTAHLSNSVWQYRMAAEFLTLGPPSPDSLRGVATIISTNN